MKKDKMKIAIIDVQLGNLHSLEDASKTLVYSQSFILNLLTGVQKIILPGVSSFDAFMSRIQQSVGKIGYLLTLIAWIHCLVFALECKYYSIIVKKVLKTVCSSMVRLSWPHTLTSTKYGLAIFAEFFKINTKLQFRTWVLFLHSYECTVNDPEAEISYSNEIVATVIKNNVFGVHIQRKVTKMVCNL